MRINLNTYNYGNKNINRTNLSTTKSIFNTNNQQNLFVQNKDTVSFTSTKPIQFNEQNVCKIYNRVYDSVLKESIKENPVLKNVKINKPEFKFLENCATGVIAYVPQENSIHVNAKTFDRFNKDMSLFVIEENGETTFSKRFLNEEEKAILPIKAQMSGVNGKVITFTDKEKELYIETFFAHECRHAIQSHFQLSTEGVSEKCKEHFKEEAEYLKEAIKAGEITKDSPFYNISYDYVLNYKPQKLLFSDEKIAMSGTYNGEKIYWKAADFDNGGQTGEGDSPRYLMRANEIDAYKYECDYVDKKVETQPELYRKEFQQFHHLEKEAKYQKGLYLRKMYSSFGML